MSEEEGTKTEKNAELWMALGTLIGLNQLANEAKTLGEKIFLRLARDHVKAEYIKLGGQINEQSDPPEIIVPTRPPFVALSPEDIELMRAAVAEYDEKKRRRAHDPWFHASWAGREQKYITPEDITTALNAGGDPARIRQIVLDAISKGQCEDHSLCALVAATGRKGG